jgi:hypothetical protein
VHSFGGRTLLDLAARRCGHRDGASLNSGPMLVAGGAVILCDGTATAKATTTATATTTGLR